jgi:sortase A
VTTAAIAIVALALSAPAAAPAVGAPFATIEIPSLGVHALVREGVSVEVLERGPGHYPGTGIPGGGGTIAIAAHRVTHTRAFHRVNELRRGQRIVLSRRSRTYGYRVWAMRIVAPKDVWPLFVEPGVETLVLTACHPPGTDARRLVVFARRVPA